MCLFVLVRHVPISLRHVCRLFWPVRSDGMSVGLSLFSCASVSLASRPPETGDRGLFLEPSFSPFSVSSQVAFHQYPSMYTAQDAHTRQTRIPMPQHTNISITDPSPHLPNNIPKTHPPTHHTTNPATTITPAIFNTATLSPCLALRVSLPAETRSEVLMLENDSVVLSMTEWEEEAWL